MNSVEISKAHLKLSDVYMRDAAAGVQSTRGRVDSAFDAGYFALLSVLTDAEREELDHPSRYVVEIASARLGLDSATGHELRIARYSADEPASVSEVASWAEGVRSRVRELGIK